MKRILFLFIMLSSVYCRAQVIPADSTLIREACENYVGGFYNADTMRLAQALHPELAKRIVAKRMDDKLMNMSAAELIKAAKGFKNTNDKNPQEPFKITVFIYDIANDISEAKIITNKMNFIDYVQLVKIKGAWKIINVLWAFNKS